MIHLKNDDDVIKLKQYTICRYKGNKRESVFYDSSCTSYTTWMWNNIIDELIICG